MLDLEVGIDVIWAPLYYRLLLHYAPLDEAPAAAVGPDGSIPADQIARLGLRPGACRLRCCHCCTCLQLEGSEYRRSSRSLRGLVISSTAR